MALTFNGVGTGKPATGTTTGYRYGDYNSAVAKGKQLAQKNGLTLPSSYLIKKDEPKDEPKGYTGVGGGNSVTNATSGDDIIAKLRDLLEEQTRASNASAKAWYDQYMSQLRGDTIANLDRSNKQYKLDMKRDREIHGTVPDVGSGYTNRAMITQKWRDRNNAYRMNEANNSATALANYQSQLANNASTLAQNWSNHILPYYVNQANKNA